MAIPTTFDSLFQWAGKAYNIPPAFLKALSYHESAFRPDARPMKDGKQLSSAVGLFQPLKATTEAFNKANPGNNYTQDDMLDPQKNAVVGAWLVSQIVKEYAKTGVPSLKEDWASPVYAGLAALGYVAGWSSEQGVAHIAKKLWLRDYRGAITPAVIVEYAQQWFPNSEIYSNGKGYMSDPALLVHVAKIARDYAGLIGKPIEEKSPLRPTVEKNTDTPRESNAGIVSVAAIFGLLAFLSRKK